MISKKLCPASIRFWLLKTFCFALLLAPIAGCQSWFKKGTKEEDNQFVKETKRIKELMADPDRPRLVGEVANITGLTIRQYDALGLVTGLEGTGGKVKPSQQRDMMLAEMKVIGIESPEYVLDAPWSALTKVRVYGNPCDGDNEIVDVGVEVSAECDATDISGGTLLEARLREMVLIGGKIRTSGDKAFGKGELVTLPASFTQKESDKLKAIVVGGGRLLEPQGLGLQMQPEFKHVMVVKAIEKSLNKRFYFHQTKQHMMAEGKNDSRLIITTVPKYRWDAAHFASVMLATGFAESPEERDQRLEGCKRLLKDRVTVRRAAAELEAIGTPEAIDILSTGLSSVDTEIRFYSAYSLAYLDQKEAIPTLVELAKREPAFRPVCLVGLTILEKEEARAALVALLQETEPELRFGALIALQRRDPTDPIVQGERIAERIEIVQVPSNTSLVAPSLQLKQQIVLFGNSPEISLTRSMNPTTSFSIHPASGNQIRITKRLPGDVVNAVVPPDLLALLRSMGSVGASYNDMVQTIEMLRERKSLQTLVVFDPRPRAGRTYKRESDGASDSDDELVAVDGTTRLIEKKSWWKLPNPFARVGKSADSSKTMESSRTTEDKEEAKERTPYKSVMRSEPSDPLDALGTTAASSSDELPEIDWDEIQ